jgi:2-succinyl-5-enolpyruvyl-6-hydroxy-3-cyclohexene-1-carboxylate synthase
VTSGTAVANLMPAVCEARESRLAILLLTADRPSHSWGVGEYQTIRQHDMFDQFAGFAKNFPAPNSETRKLLANEIVPSMLSDIAFGVGEVMKIRGQVVHFNFQFLKPELQPMDLNDGFARDWNVLSSQSRHLKKYRNRLIPFTCHVHAKAEGIQVPCSLQNAMHARRCILVCGELTSPIEAISLSHFCLKWKIPCIAEVTSGMLPSSYVLLGVDQILFDHSIQKALQKHVDVVVRVGGPLISARLQDWSSKTGHSLIRVLDDSFANTRHDPQWSADEYIHIPLGDFLMSCEDCMRRDSSIEPEYEVQSRCEERIRFAYISNAISGAYQSAIAELANHCFNEISIACKLGNKSSVFLSSSMPCRDFAIFGSLNVTPEMQRCGYRLVASNRGANGIDGVVSSAAGFSAATNSQTFLLIGDVSTLHDLSGVAVALNAQPGRTDMRNNVKIVCVNNSGGAIFSFLPIKDHATVFNPFFDTPHSTDLHAIANGIADGSAVQVASLPALERALFDSKARFIECINLATHAENVALHKHIGSAVIARLQNLVRT